MYGLAESINALSIGDILGKDALDHLPVIVKVKF
jgi:hypothetical protein